MNRIILIGRIVRDLELRYTNTQKEYLRFPIAVDRRYTKDGERETDFIDCVAWGKTAEFMTKYLAKGSKIAVTGRLQVDSYQKKDGTNAKSASVIVEDVEFVESKKQVEEKPKKDFNPVDDSWIPF